MKLFMSVLAVFGISTIGLAEGTSVWVDQTILDHNSNSTKQGDNDAVKTTTMKGFDANMEVKVNHGDWHVYFFPHAQVLAYDSNGDGVKLDETPGLKFGMDVMKDLEAGLWFGMASSKVDDGVESSTSAIGFYGLYTVDLSGAALEAELGYQMISLNSKIPSSTNVCGVATGATTAAESKCETKGSIMNLDVEYVRQIGGAWHYVGGLNYKAVNVESTPKFAGSAGDKVKTTMTDTGLKLIGFRFKF